MTAASARDIYHLPTGSVVIRYSNPSDPEPFYLQRVTNDREKNGYWAVHMIFGERAETLDEAQWRANEVADGEPVVIDEVAWAHRAEEVRS